MATIVAAAGGGDWSVGATWVGGVAPTIADDAQLNSTSGAVTITGNVSCRSLDCNTYTGTLTHNAATTLSIGTTTPGTSNIALRFNTGMTYTRGSITTSAITFTSTSATIQTITTNAKILGNVTFNPASNGSWQLADSLTSTSGILTLTRGTLDTNGQTVTISTFSSSNSNVRILTLGSSVINISAGTLFSATGLTFTANTATVNVTGGNLNLAGVNTNGTSFIMSGSGTPTLSVNGTTVANLTRTGTATKTDGLSFNAASFTVTGTLTLAGNSTVNRLLVKSDVPGTARSFTAATVSLANVDFIDITGSGAAAPFSGTSLGDGRGNSNITFTVAVTRYAVAAGNWSNTAMWASSSGGTGGASVPLCHDTVILDANSGAGTYSVDMPLMGKDILCTGFTRSLSLGSTSAFGDFVLGTAMTFNPASVSLLGRGTHVITSSGKAFGSGSLTITAPGGSYALTDALTVSGSASDLSVTGGTFSSNNLNVTVGRAFTFSGTTTLNLGTSTLTTTSTTGTIFTNSATTSNTGSVKIVLSSASATSRTFGGGGKTYGTLTYIVSGSTGALVVTGANTFGTLNFFDAANARTLTLPSSTTTTITGTFNVQGTAGKLMTVNSSISSTAATVTKTTGQVACNYLSLRDSTATGGIVWYAGGNSVNVSNVTGWTFTQAPAPRFFDFFD